MKTAACVAVACIASIVSSAEAGARCPGRTVVSAERWRIVEQDSIYLACLRTGGKGVELIGVETGADLGRVAAAGRYFAYEGVSNSSSGAAYWLGFGDMKTGRSELVGDEPTRFVVRATGSLVWSSDDSDGLNTHITLTRLGRRSKTLASGPGVDAASLRRVGHRAVWLEDGERRSALMP